MFKFDHISISVENLQETIEFYSKFGFIIDKEFHNDELDIVFMSKDGIRLEMFHYKEHHELPEHSKSLDSDLRTIGVKHFCLYVQDIIEAKNWVIKNKLAGNGIEIKKGRTCTAYFFIKDPNGIMLEILQK